MRPDIEWYYALDPDVASVYIKKIKQKREWAILMCCDEKDFYLVFVQGTSKGTFYSFREARRNVLEAREKYK